MDQSACLCRLPTTKNEWHSRYSMEDMIERRGWWMFSATETPFVVMEDHTSGTGDQLGEKFGSVDITTRVNLIRKLV